MKVKCLVYFNLPCLLALFWGCLCGGGGGGDALGGMEFNFFFNLNTIILMSIKLLCLFRKDRLPHRISLEKHFD